MDMIGYASPDTNVASIKAAGPYKVVINLKTIDSQFIAANLNAQFVVPKHIWSKVANPATFTNANAGRLWPVRGARPLHGAGLRLQQEPALLEAGRAEDPVPRIHAGVVERLGAARDPERPGRLDAQLRPERRAGVLGEGSRALPLLLCDDGVSASHSSSTPPSIRSASSRSARRSASRSTAATCRSSVSTATRRRPTRSASTTSSRSGTRAAFTRLRRRPRPTTRRRRRSC